MYTLIETPIFINNVDHLPKDAKKQLAQKIKYLETSPDHPSLESHRVNNTRKGRTIYESYVDRKQYRILWEYVSSNEIALWEVVQHDGLKNAYNLPDFDPSWITPPEIQDQPTPVYFADQTAQPIFQGMTDNHLRLFGVPDEFIDIVRQLTDIEMVWDLHMPQPAIFTLYDIFSRREDWTNDGIFDVRWLMYKANADEIESYCNGHIKQLLLNLKEDQQAVVQMDVNGPLLIKGTAGSGKTTIGLYRAHRLAQQRFIDGPPSVLILTYTRLLAKTLEELYIDLYGVKEQNLQFAPILDYMFESLFPGKKPEQIIPNGQTLNLYFSKKISEIKTRLNLKNLPTYLLPGFVTDEIRYIKGRGIATLEEYLALKRTGRGQGLGETQRIHLWEVYEHYQTQLRSKRHIDWDDIPRMMLERLENSQGLRFDVVIVDEAQDLRPMTLKAVRAMMKDRTNGTGLTLLADPAQSIYYSGIPWRDANLMVAGSRTQVLRKNYRNSRQVLVAAKSLVENATHLMATNEYIDPEVADREGPKPVVFYAIAPDEETDQLAKKIINLCQRGLYRPGDIAVLARETGTLTQIDRVLKTHDLFTNHYKSDDFKVLENEIKLITMHSAKGLEFPVVFVIGVNDGVVPLSVAGNDDEAKDQERKLLYVSMTRASERLYITALRNARSPFLRDIDAELIEVRKFV